MIETFSSIDALADTAAGAVEQQLAEGLQDRGRATLVAADASALYARNVLDFLKLIVDKDAALAINREDEIVAATLLCHGGEILRKQ